MPTGEVTSFVADSSPETMDLEVHQALRIRRDVGVGLAKDPFGQACPRRRLAPDRRLGRPMDQESSARSCYEVVVDKGSLHGHAAQVEGTGYAVEGPVYSVGLAGSVDERWTHAFHIVQLDSTGLIRYRLDPAKRTVSFQVRSNDGADRVIFLLERLDQLVGEVNRNASFWGKGGG